MTDEQLSEPPQAKRWSVRRRLEFMDFRLFWDGRFTRAALAETFGMSPQQASADIALYDKLAPGNMFYDHPQRAFIRAGDFAPKFAAESADRYLLQLMAVQSGLMRQEETWFEHLPPLDVAFLGRRATDPVVLLGMVDAVRTKAEISIEYHSMTGTPDSPRQIAPHAFFYARGSWYARAWSRDRNDFRDYSLNRIKATSVAGLSQVDPSLDYEWHNEVTLQITPNPALPDELRRAVDLEYQMVGGVLAYPVRISLSFYLLSEHNLDVDSGVLPALKQRLVLANRAEVTAARTVARNLSEQALGRLRNA